MRAALWWGLALVGVAGEACECNRTQAACEQTLVALCEYEATCYGGVAIDACVAARPNFTCTVDVDASAVCVEAINEVLRRDCADPPADLPCPLLTQAGLYEPCGGDLVCAESRECLVVADAPLCSARCDDQTACPSGGGCSDDDVCGPTCDVDGFRCDDGSGCSNGRCELCATLCTTCGTTVDGCDCDRYVAGCQSSCADRCETCESVVEDCDCRTELRCPVPCDDPSDCAFGVCNEGVCGG